MRAQADRLGRVGFSIYNFRFSVYNCAVEARAVGGMTILGGFRRDTL